MPNLEVLTRLLRSGAAGLLATLADLAALTALVHVAKLEPRIASAPALALGMVVMFFAQRKLAFRSRGHVGKQAVLFALVQLGGFLLTLALFDLGLRFIPSAQHYYVPLRLVVSNLVWLAYSFPLWHLVFRERQSLAKLAGAEEAR